jgi:pilus assembly protein Flp/PilA
MIRLWKLVRNERGATAIEYSLLAALVAVAALGSMVLLGATTGGMWNDVSDNVQKASK